MTEDQPDTHDADDLEGRLEAMKRELDALQIHVMKDKAPWYKQVPVVVSLLVAMAALGFSFWTDAKAEDRLARERQREARVELRGVIQRLQILPRESIDIKLKYATDPAAQAEAAGLVNTESLVLARQAAELIEELEGKVTAAEYWAVIDAYFETGQISPDLEKLIADGQAVANDGQSAAVMQRFVARLRFRVGDVTGGRAAFEQALGVFQRFPEDDQGMVNITQAQTEAIWADEELGHGDCDEARRHFTLAQGHYAAYLPLQALRESIETLCA